MISAWRTASIGIRHSVGNGIVAGRVERGVGVRARRAYVAGNKPNQLARRAGTGWWAIRRTERARRRRCRLRISRHPHPHRWRMPYGGWDTGGGAAGPTLEDEGDSRVRLVTQTRLSRRPGAEQPLLGPGRATSPLPELPHRPRQRWWASEFGVFPQDGMVKTGCDPVRSPYRSPVCALRAFELRVRTKFARHVLIIVVLIANTHSVRPEEGVHSLNVGYAAAILTHAPSGHVQPRVRPGLGRPSTPSSATSTLSQGGSLCPLRAGSCCCWFGKVSRQHWPRVPLVIAAESRARRLRVAGRLSLNPAAQQPSSGAGFGTRLRPAPDGGAEPSGSAPPHLLLSAPTRIPHVPYCRVVGRFYLSYRMMTDVEVPCLCPCPSPCSCFSAWPPRSFTLPFSISPARSSTIRKTRFRWTEAPTRPSGA